MKHLLTNSKAGPDSPRPLQETKQVCDGGIFFCVNSDKAVAKFLQERNIPYCLLKNIKSLKEKKISCIVFDLREFTPEDFELLEWASREGIATIQVTDLGLSQCRVDYTIDASIDKLFPYEEGKQILNGPAYTLLHQKFRHFNKLKRHHRKCVKYLLVSLGGGVQYR
ncbi:MAG: hypothetical protein GY757_44225, partial [bacterium]|nr:hypothetical protein [bacterium]